MKSSFVRLLLAAALSAGLLTPSVSGQPVDVYWLHLNTNFLWRTDGNWTDHYPGSPEPDAPQLPVARFNFFDELWGGTGNTTAPILPESRIGITFPNSAYPDAPGDVPLSAIILEDTNTIGRWFRNSSGAVTSPTLIQRFGYVTLHGLETQINGKTVNLLLSNASANPYSELVDLRFHMVNANQIISVRLPRSGVIHTEHPHNRVWIMVPVYEMDEPVTITKTGPGILQFSQSYTSMPGRTEITGGLVVEGGILQTTYNSTVADGAITASPFGYMPVTMRTGTALRAAASGARTLHNGWRFEGTVTLGGPHSEALTPEGTPTNSGGLTFSAAGGGSTELLADTTLNVLSTATFNQSVSGNFRLTKDGTETLTFSAETNFPFLTVRQGLVTFPSLGYAGDADVLSEGILGGSGIFEGDIVVRSGGTLAPGGNNSGILTIGKSLTLESGARLSFNLAGTIPGIQHSQLVVDDVMSLEGVELNLVLGYQPSAQQTFVLVENRSASAFPGKLYYNGQALEEGDEFLVQTGSYSEVFSITYKNSQGGYDNSIAVTAGGTVDLGMGNYTAWRTSRFGSDTDPAGDPVNQPAGQPVANLLYHALGLDLITSEADGLPALAVLEQGLPDIEGLKLHLDASAPDTVTVGGGQVVTQWHDRSGQDIVFTVGAGNPVFVSDAINGLPAIQFDGAFLQTTSPNALRMTNGVQGFTAFAVARNTGTSDQTIFRIGRGSGSTAAGLRLMLARTSSQHRFLVRRVDNGDFNTVLSGAGTISPNTWGIDAGVANYVADYAGIYINGRLMAFNDALLGDPGLASPTDSQMFRIGNDHDTQFWRGEIAEILMYNRTLSEGEILAVHSYLSEKYGIPLDPGPISGLTINFTRRALLGTKLVVEATSGNLGGEWEQLAVLQPGARSWTGPAPVVEEAISEDLVRVIVIDPAPATGQRLIRLRATLP